MANRRPFKPCAAGCGNHQKNRWGYCRECLQAAGLRLRPCGQVEGYGQKRTDEIMASFIKLNAGRIGQPLLAPPLPVLHWNAGKRARTEATKRRCLSCPHEFLSAGPHNRICTSCKANEDWRGGNFNDWNVGGVGGSGRFTSGLFPTSVR